MSINPLLALAVLGTGVLLVPAALHIQAQQPCFLQGADGRQLNLGHLCEATPAPVTTPELKAFQIPIKRRLGNIPTVNVTFNGTHTFEMLFDTGATAIAITPRMANIMGIKVEKEGITETAGGSVKMGIGRVASVTAGNYSAKNLKVGIVSSLREPGLLGQNFYGHYDVTIKQKVIELRVRE
jgi:aspartyl protease family protein